MNKEYTFQVNLKFNTKQNSEGFTVDKSSANTNADTNDFISMLDKKSLQLTSLELYVYDYEDYTDNVVLEKVFDLQTVPLDEAHKRACHLLEPYIFYNNHHCNIELKNDNVEDNTDDLFPEIDYERLTAYDDNYDPYVVYDYIYAKRDDNKVKDDKVKDNTNKTVFDVGRFLHESIEHYQKLTKRE